MIIKEIHKFSKNKLINKNLIMLLVICLFISCNFLENQMTNKKEITAEEILNNPDYLAISYLLHVLLIVRLGQLYAPCAIDAARLAVIIPMQNVIYK